LDENTGQSEGEGGNYADQTDQNEDECNCTSDSAHNTGDAADDDENAAKDFPNDSDCSPCEGGITYLNLAYLGNAPADIIVTGEIKGKKGSKGSKGKKNKETWEQVFTSVEKGGMLEVKTPEGAEKLGTWIYLSIDGGEPTGIHTSCSQDIKVGMTLGNYKVLAGASLKGGPFCEEIPPNDCKECFSASAINIAKESDGYHYSMEINQEDCRFDLSQLTIEIPACYNIISFSNSMGWNMEEHADPATGLGGLKIHDIPSPGNDGNLSPLIIEFVLDADNEACKEDLNCFTPVIAYKSATCVYEEITTGECYIEEEEQQFTVGTYPNPTRDYVKIDMKNADKSASYVADIYNFSGEKTHSYQLQKGFTGEILVDLRSKKQGLYFLKLTGSQGISITHRIVKY